jgi:predicted phage baseplate assembly protein
VGGVESTLTVRVNDVEWQAQDSLYAQSASAEVYTMRIDNDGKAHVIFGDGKHGARLPTGQENVVAEYRNGIGEEGEVDADSLTLLKTRPFGIRGVANPLSASGGEDPEKLDDARTNAPLTVLTMERIVSLQDYEDYARAFPGIGKAQAVEVWDGEVLRVHITVADSDGDAVISPLFDNLLESIQSARDPLREVILESYQPFVFFLTANVLIDDRYEWEIIKADIESELLSAFSFEKRAFAQPVTAAEVMEVVHNVSDMIAVDIDELYKSKLESIVPSGPVYNTVLDAHPARFHKVENKIKAAELLTIHEFGIKLAEMNA